MTKEEAQRQVEGFFRRLGEKISFADGASGVKARVGEAFLGFEHDAADGVLSVQALVYRFRRPPRDELIDAAFAEDEKHAGGGRIVYDSENLSLYLQRDFAEIEGDKTFSAEINRLALASLEWNATVLARLSEKIAAGKN